VKSLTIANIHRYDLNIYISATKPRHGLSEDMSDEAPPPAEEEPEKGEKDAECGSDTAMLEAMENTSRSKECIGLTNAKARFGSDPPSSLPVR